MILWILYTEKSEVLELSYLLKVALANKDKVDSYAAIHKFSTCCDAGGIVRLELNSKPLSQLISLDQDWWLMAFISLLQMKICIMMYRKRKIFTSSDS